ncbi:hypothetical protein J6590_029427 [Homalodisca vitripennis]|nr:hypothetical protein J6590_029427 [Homalodisca vitripennis]
MTAATRAHDFPQLCISDQSREVETLRLPNHQQLGRRAACKDRIAQRSTIETAILLDSVISQLFSEHATLRNLHYLRKANIGLLLDLFKSLITQLPYPADKAKILQGHLHLRSITLVMNASTQTPADTQPVMPTPIAILQKIYSSPTMFVMGAPTTTPADTQPVMPTPDSNLAEDPTALPTMFVMELMYRRWLNSLAIVGLKPGDLLLGIKQLVDLATSATYAAATFNAPIPTT